MDEGPDLDSLLKSSRHLADQWAMPTDPIIIIIGGSLFAWLLW